MGASSTTSAIEIQRKKGPSGLIREDFVEGGENGPAGISELRKRSLTEKKGINYDQPSLLHIV